MTHDIKAPVTHANHPVVGHYFRNWEGKIYFCDSYDPQLGYWMTDVLDHCHRRNVSERAIGRTYHEQTPSSFLNPALTRSGPS